MDPIRAGGGCRTKTGLAAAAMLVAALVLPSCTARQDPPASSPADAEAGSVAERAARPASPVAAEESRDEIEIAYYRSIEDFFAAARGVPHILSSKDVQRPIREVRKQK